jgi:branched-chain amino acid transport system ATP-binding protein
MLEVDNVHAGYGRIPVLSGVNFTIAEHEVVGVLGHNGMGKTTLLRTLIGQIPLARGTVRFGSAEITNMSSFRRVRAGMGYVPQGRAIFPGLTVRENLRMGFIEDGLHSEDEAIREACLRFPRLYPIIDRVGGTLSGGEQQILALARCLCGRPKLVLLDEPTEGIQPSIVEEILEVLVDLQHDQGLAIIVVEQNLDFIRRISDRVLLIEKGAISREVPPEILGEAWELDGYRSQDSRAE